MRAAEATFCEKLNALLDRYGCTCYAYSISDDMLFRQTYALTFSKGSKRHTLRSDMPFHFDPPEEALESVKDWFDGNVGGDSWSRKWSADPKFAD